MNLYISDLHFGHKNVIRFEHRPFADVEEMDHCLISLWNARVNSDDHVYILGDFAYKNGRAEEWYLRQLKGHKHLIIGNHDTNLLKNEKAMAYFESAEHMALLHDESERICLCHYPIADWIHSHHGSWLLYGHIHNDSGEVYQFMKTRTRALNVGACINRYTPASMRELIENNARFHELRNQISKNI